MMARSDLDTVRARLADAAYLPFSEVTDIASQLLAEVECARMREALVLAEHADLAAAAQAALTGKCCREAETSGDHCVRRP